MESRITKDALLEKAKQLDGESNENNTNTDDYSSRLNNGQTNSDQHMIFDRSPIHHSMTDNYGSESSNNRYEESTPNKGNNKNPSAQTLDGRTVRGGSPTVEKSKLESLRQRINELESEIIKKDIVIGDLKNNLVNSTTSYKETLTVLEETQSKYKEQIDDLQLNEDKNLILKNKIKELEDENEEIEKKFLMLKAENESFSNFIDKLTLFDIPIGSIIRKNFEGNEVNSKKQILPFFKMLEDYGFDINHYLAELRANDESVLDEQLQQIIQHTEKSQQEDDTRFTKAMEKLNEIENKLIEAGTPVRELLDELKGKISIEIKKYQEELNQNNSLLEDKDDKLKSLETIIEEKDSRYDELLGKYEKQKGDESQCLTFDDFKCPDVPKKVFDRLELSDIDNLDMVSLRNSLKQVCVDIQTPFSKLQRKIILANMLIKSELVMSLNFINLLYYHVFEDNLDFENWTDGAYMQYQRTRDIDAIRHPLNPVLNDLYKEIMEKIEMNTN